jgi:hypothetical protein
MKTTRENLVEIVGDEPTGEHSLQIQIQITRSDDKQAVTVRFHRGRFTATFADALQFERELTRMLHGSAGQLATLTVNAQPPEPLQPPSRAGLATTPPDPRQFRR